MVTRGPPALQDYISLFPLDDMQPSKLMRLLSSNEEDANILCSPSECAPAGPGSSLPCPRRSAVPRAGVLAGCSEGMWQVSPCGPLLCLLPTESPKVAVDSPEGLKLPCPDPVPAWGVPLSLPHPLLTTRRGE